MAPAPQAKPRRHLVAIALAAVGLTLALCGGLTLHATNLDEGAIAKRYNARADAARAELYARPPSDLNHAPGPAAPLYQRAYEGCPAFDKPQIGAQVALLSTLGALTRPHAPLPSPLPLPAACVALGAPDRSDHPIAATLSEDLCEKIAACAPALDLLIEGSLRQTGRSPMSLQEPWAEGRDPRHFVTLIQLALARAALDGDSDRLLDATLALARVSVDLGLGARAHVNAEAARALTLTTAPLTRWLADDALDQPQLERALRALTALNARPLSFKAAAEAEYLAIVPMWRLYDALDPPPGAMTPPRPPADFVEALLLRNAFKIQERTLADTIEASRLGGLQQRARLDALFEDQKTSPNPLVRAAAADHGQHALLIHAAAARVGLLELLAAARLHLRRHHALPNSPTQLSDITGEKLPGDPLVGGAFAFENTPGGIRLASYALDPGMAPALGIAQRHQRDGLEFSLAAPEAP